MSSFSYAIQAPAMSHALILESTFRREGRALKAHAAMYILRNFDEMIALEEFVVREVPNGTSDELNLFEEAL